MLPSKNNGEKKSGLVSKLSLLCPFFRRQSIHVETERRQPQLQAVVDLAEALKTVLRGHGGLVDDKVSLLHCNWIAVTSRAEEWLNLLLVRGRKNKHPICLSYRC